MNTGLVGRVVAAIRYKPGWGIRLGGPAGQYLCATARNPDSSPPHDPTHTGHMFPLPLGFAELDDTPESRATVVRWVYECLLLAERHEAGEWFSFEHRRVFFPGHQGVDPYAHLEHWQGTSADPSTGQPT